MPTPDGQHTECEWLEGLRYEDKFSECDECARVAKLNENPPLGGWYYCRTHGPVASPSLERNAIHLDAPSGEGQDRHNSPSNRPKET